MKLYTTHPDTMQWSHPLSNTLPWLKQSEHLTGSNLQKGQSNSGINNSSAAKTGGRGGGGGSAGRL